MNRAILSLAIMLGLASQAYAQSTAQPVLPGMLVTSGCPPGYTSCYVPYSNANPLPVTGGGGGTSTANQGTPNAGGATNSWPVQGAGVAGTPAGGVVSVQGVSGGTPQPANTTQIGGNAISTGTGASGTGTQRVVTSTDSTIGVEGQDGSTQASTSNPVPTNIAQLNGAVPSLTNPIYTANAEAADVSGTFTNGTQTTSITNTSADGYAAGLISINGTYGTASGVFEASDDAGTTWYSVVCGRSDGTASETGYTSLTNTNRQWSCPVGGNDSIRVRSTAVASGTVNVRVGISAPPPSSTVTTGSVTVTQPTGTNLHAVLDATSTTIVTQATAANLNATVTAASLPLPTGAATSANQPTNVTQGSTTSGETGLLNYCATLSAAPTYTTAQSNPCNISVKGAIPTTFDGVNSTNLTGSPFAILDRGGSSRILATGGFGYNGTTQDVLRTAQGAASANTGVGVLAVEESGRTFSHISTSTTTTVKSGAGFLHAIIVNSLGTVASTTTVYDNTAGSGTVIAIINSLTISGTLTYDIAFSTGLTIVTTGTVAPDETVSYR